MEKKKNCFNCNFNFDGICACHQGIFNFYISNNGISSEKFDVYGMDIKSVAKLFPNGCDDFEQFIFVHLYS